ncbi:hypothetical protein QL285_008803 [Trifolium repens]|nr:hypothetical protein QL285_008803 [Trifolium repens]
MADSMDISCSSKRKRVRGPTMLKEIQKVRRTGVKMWVEFDPETTDCIGNNACIFHSYVALVARERCSILKDEWKDISDEVKQDIWKDIEDHFDIPKYDDKEKTHLKKVWINYAGERWRDFKARLTGNYITRPEPGAEPPYVKKRVKGARIIWQKMFTDRHGLSRGGYRKLKETMMNEKRLLKSKDDSTLIDDDTPPSPPDRYEKWTRARTKKGGGYTSEAVKKVAEKIDYLVEETKKGSFLPDGRNDILTEAIGTSEHGGRVRGIEKNIILALTLEDRKF